MLSPAIAVRGSAVVVVTRCPVKATESKPRQPAPHDLTHAPSCDTLTAGIKRWRVIPTCEAARLAGPQDQEKEET